MISRAVSFSESRLFSRLLLIQNAGNSFRDNFGEHFVDLREKANGAIVFEIFLFALFVKQDCLGYLPNPWYSLKLEVPRKSFR